MKIHVDDKNVVAKITKELNKAMTNKGNRPVVIICIGTDRSTGDSLGPLVGSYLDKRIDVPVFGTMTHPVHATNLVETLELINKSYDNPYVIGVDACLGRLESVGCIEVIHGPVYPGAALDKDLPPVGDCSVIGIVNVGGFMEHLVLQSTRLYGVIVMARRISQIIQKALKQEKKSNNFMQEVAATLTEEARTCLR